MKATGQKLYFIAIVPPDPIKKAVREFKEICAKEYDTKAALRSPPHITLHMPFKMSIEKVQKLLGKLASSLNGFNEFEIKLQNFGSFPPRVIYVEVNDEPDLSTLHNSINELMKMEFKILSQEYKGKPFHPHMTIAFRDLKKSDFRKAWERFKEEKFSGEFTCDSVCLLEHNGKFWETKSEIKFN